MTTTSPAGAHCSATAPAVTPFRRTPLPPARKILRDFRIPTPTSATASAACGRFSELSRLPGIGRCLDDVSDPLERLGHIADVAPSAQIAADGPEQTGQRGTIEAE